MERVRWLACLLLTPAWAQESAQDHYNEGVALYENGQVEDAAFALERAVRAPGTNPSLHARIEMYLGIVRAQLNDHEGARDAFRQSFEADAKVGPLPPKTPPEVVAMFEEARASARPAKLGKPVTSFLSPTKHKSDSIALGSMGGEKGQRKGRPRWVIWAAAGGTVVAMTVAIAAGISANSAESAAGERDITVYEALDRIDQARSRAKVANVFWGLTIVGAIGTGVLYYTW